MDPHNFRSRFGRPKPPAIEPEEPLFSGDAESADDNLDLPDTASLTGISIRRKEGAIAKPAVQPAAPVAGIVRSEQAPPRDIVEYTNRLRKGRRWAARADIDAKQIALHWPNTLLMRVGLNGFPWRFESLISGVMRGGGQSFNNGDIEFNPMVMEWVLGIGRNTAAGGKAVEDTDVFPTAQGNVRYRALAVPLGETDAEATFVLCHVERR